MFKQLTTGLIVGAVIAATTQAQTTQPHPQETAAVKLIQQADKDIAAKEYNKAIASLKQAGRLVPDDLDIQYKLATTLLAADRMPEMWKVLRSAAMKNPNHPEIARGLLSYWRMFDEQGLFNCNHETIDKVISVLGGPDHMVKGPDRDRYVWGFIGVEVKHGQKTIHQTMDLRGLTRKHLAPPDFVSVDLDGRGWKVGHRTTNKDTTLAEFILPGERVQRWTQLFSIQRLHGLGRKKASVRQIAEGMMASLEKTNAQRKYRLLEVSEESVTFEWTAPATKTHKSQHELVKLMRGAIDVHRLAFVVRDTQQMDEKLRQQWLGLFAKAELKPVPGGAATSEPKKTSSPVTDQLAWKFGHHLSIFVFAHAQKNEKVARPNLLQAIRLAEQMKFTMPRPFQLTDDAATNVIRAVGYLNEDTLAAMHKSGMADAQIATFELSARTTTLAMVCSNNDLTAKSMLMINKAAKRSQLPEALVAALNERVKAGGSPDEIRKVVQKLQADAAVYLGRNSDNADNKTADKESARMTSQILYMNGSKLGEITGDGEVWIGGDRVGDITSDGEIWVGGDKEGEITSDGEVWKSGNKIGDITKNGEVWLEGDKVGSIEKNGDVWRNGSNIGSVKGGTARNAAAVLFFGFYDLGA